MGIHTQGNGSLGDITQGGMRDGESVQQQAVVRSRREKGRPEKAQVQRTGGGGNPEF